MTISWQKIQNREQLLSVGATALRRYAVDIIEYAIRAADPYSAAKELIERDGHYIRLNDKIFDLQASNIYIIGAGKASQPIAFALEEILGDLISEGLIVIKQGEKSMLNRIETIEAGHPVPNEKSFLAAKKVLEISEKATKNDIVFALFTGGSSSLMVCPAKGIRFDELQKVYKLLLNCGASIREINAVRKHISRIKGGRLAKEIFPARLINLTVSDVIGDPIDYITDLTVPDTSTWEDAWKTMDAYQLWGLVPSSVEKFMRERRNGETPKEFDTSVNSWIIVPGDAAYHSAIQRCEELGFITRKVNFFFEGESCLAAKEIVLLAERMVVDHPLHDKFALIGRGETTVLIKTEEGIGGPNQELALCAALQIIDRSGIVVAAIGTDGTDGPCEASGGLVDGTTIQRALVKNISPNEYLEAHDSMNFLKETGDLIITGPTYTNVNDLMFVLIEKERC